MHSRLERDLGGLGSVSENAGLRSLQISRELCFSLPNAIKDHKIIRKRKDIKKSHMLSIIPSPSKPIEINKHLSSWLDSQPPQTLEDSTGI